MSTSLYRQGAYTVSFDLNTFLLTGHAIAIGERESMGNPCMNNYMAGDGRRFWIVGLQVDRHWGPLCRVVGRPDWMTDYPRPRDRAANCRHLIAELDEIFATKPLDEWAKIVRAPNRISSGRRSTRSRTCVADEQFHAAGGIVYVPDGDSSVPMVATPADFHGTPWAPRAKAPGIGEHTEEILGELEPTRRLSCTDRGSSPRLLHARGVAKLGQELVVVVAAHEVVRNRNAHGGRGRQRGVRSVSRRSNRSRISGMTRDSRLMTCAGSMSTIRRPG